MADEEQQLKAGHPPAGKQIEQRFLKEIDEKNNLKLRRNILHNFYLFLSTQRC